MERRRLTVKRRSCRLTVVVLNESSEKTVGTRSVDHDSEAFRRIFRDVVNY